MRAAVVELPAASQCRRNRQLKPRHRKAWVNILTQGTQENNSSLDLLNSDFFTK